MRITNQLWLFLLLTSATLYAQQSNKSTIWEKEIKAFESMDSIEMPQKEGTLFVGSSSIRGWRSVNQDFPRIKTLNRGFGGAEFKDINYYFDRVVAIYQPKQVIIYAGDNDIAGGKSPKKVFQDFKVFYRKLRRQLPHTQLIALSIKPSIKRWNLSKEMESTNKKIRRFSMARKGKIKFIDVWSPMLTQEGIPNSDFFIGDGLHMNSKGYELWKQKVDPYLNP